MCVPNLVIVGQAVCMGEGVGSQNGGSTAPFWDGNVAESFRNLPHNHLGPVAPQKEKTFRGPGKLQGRINQRTRARWLRRPWSLPPMSLTGSPYSIQFVVRRPSRSQDIADFWSRR